VPGKAESAAFSHGQRPGLTVAQERLFPKNQQVKAW
jgi:hypothetical protein